MMKNKVWAYRPAKEENYIVIRFKKPVDEAEARETIRKTICGDDAEFDLWAVEVAL